MWNTINYWRDRDHGDKHNSNAMETQSLHPLHRPSTLHDRGRKRLNLRNKSNQIISKKRLRHQSNPSRCLPPKSSEIEDNAPLWKRAVKPRTVELMPPCRMRTQGIERGRCLQLQVQSTRDHGHCSHYHDQGYAVLNNRDNYLMISREELYCTVGSTSRHNDMRMKLNVMRLGYDKMKITIRTVTTSVIISTDMYCLINLVRWCTELYILY